MLQHGDAGWQNETILKQAVKSDPISNETESNTETNPINNKYLTANKSHKKQKIIKIIGCVVKNTVFYSTA